MKYLITESQLKPLMWKYFNSYEYKIITNNHRVFLVDEKGVINWEYEYDGGRLFVDNGIIFGFETMFNVSGDDALEYAGEWFEENYDYKVEEIINWEF